MVGYVEVKDVDVDVEGLGRMWMFPKIRELLA